MQPLSFNDKVYELKRKLEIGADLYHKVIGRCCIVSIEVDRYPLYGMMPKIVTLGYKNDVGSYHEESIHVSKLLPLVDAGVVRFSTTPNITIEDVPAGGKHGL